MWKQHFHSLLRCSCCCGPIIFRILNMCRVPSVKYMPPKLQWNLYFICCFFYIYIFVCSSFFAMWLLCIVWSCVDVMHEVNQKNNTKKLHTHEKHKKIMLYYCFRVTIWDGSAWFFMSTRIKFICLIYIILRFAISQILASISFLSIYSSTRVQSQ